ncbi:hypothetical protein [Nocardia aurantia]|uniref:hypothetical protein n=1 Tax=Nocardia aurantia TaxID=2585199 RepID=UPI00129692D6|nr:hypothetical protein [Nocardia aurantia]
MNVPPQIIEIAQKSAVTWVTWLPLAASGLVLIGAMVTLYVSNRTNRAAIAAADDREWIKWRREQLVSISNEILTAAHQAGTRLRGFSLWGSEGEVQIVEINNEMAAIPDLARKLELIAGDAFSREVTAIHRSVALCWIFASENFKTVHQSGRVGMAQANTEMSEMTESVGQACRDFTASVRAELKSAGLGQNVTPPSADGTEPRSSEGSAPPPPEPEPESPAAEPE